MVTLLNDDYFVFHFRRSLRRWWADRGAARLGNQVASIFSKVQTEEKSSECKKIGKILPLISDLLSFKATFFSTYLEKIWNTRLNSEGHCVGINHQFYWFKNFATLSPYGNNPL